MPSRTSLSQTWTVAEAKAKFSELIDRASRGPQTITRNGRTAAVLVSAEEWERKTRRSGNLAEFFAASPLRESGLVVERSKDKPRDIRTLRRWRTGRRGPSFLKIGGRYFYTVQALRDFYHRSVRGGYG